MIALVTGYELKSMVGDWIAYYRDQKNDDKWQRWSATSEHLDYLIDYEPWEAWALIAAIHVRDQSSVINRSLCTGPLENLLSKHGPELIETVTSFARKQPSFATLLSGIWRHRMTDEVWARVQAIRERRVWREIAIPADTERGARKP